MDIKLLENKNIHRNISFTRLLRKQILHFWINDLFKNNFLKNSLYTMYSYFDIHCIIRHLFLYIKFITKNSLKMMYILFHPFCEMTFFYLKYFFFRFPLFWFFFSVIETAPLASKLFWWKQIEIVSSNSVIYCLH